MASRVSYVPKGRNALVLCKCPDCLKVDRDGCRIESWKREAHEKAERAAKIAPPVRKKTRTGKASGMAVSGTSAAASASQYETRPHSVSSSARNLNSDRDIETDTRHAQRASPTVRINV